MCTESIDNYSKTRVTYYYAKVWHQYIGLHARNYYRPMYEWPACMVSNQRQLSIIIGLRATVHAIVSLVVQTRSNRLVRPPTRIQGVLLSTYDNKQRRQPTKMAQGQSYGTGGLYGVPTRTKTLLAVCWRAKTSADDDR